MLQNFISKANALTKKIFFNRKYFEIFILGITSGMPLVLIFSTFSAWLKELSIPIQIITTIAVARLPYSLKFLWAPIIDNLRIPLLSTFGHRKSWLILCTFLTAAVLYILSVIEPINNMQFFYFLAIILGIISATYDISFDSFRIEKFPDDLQGQASAIAIFGYRIGMLLTGAGALELSYLTNWKITFLTLSIIFFTITLYIFYIKEEYIERDKVNFFSVKDLFGIVVKPIKDFFSRESSLLILAAIILFKMGDAMLGAIAMPFYLELGFDKQQIASAVKLWGIVATLVGSYLGGVIIDKLGTFKSLIISGMTQSLTHLAFIWLFYQKTNYSFLLIAISIENLGAGIGAGVLVAYLSVLCNKKYSATQYALLSSAASLCNNTLTIWAGSLVTLMGWVNYLIFTMILALPSLLLLFYMNNKHSLTIGKKQTIE